MFRGGSVRCVQENLVMTGVYRLVGPTWNYWDAVDGRLLRFDGPIGSYAVQP